MTGKGLPPTLCLILASAKKLVMAIFVCKTLRTLKLKIKINEPLKMLIQLKQAR
jgi:hypothetical protein